MIKLMHVNNYADQKRELVKDGAGAILCQYYIGMSDTKSTKGYIYVNGGEPNKLGLNVYTQLFSHFSNALVIIKNCILRNGSWKYLYQYDADPSTPKWIQEKRVTGDNLNITSIYTCQIKWVYVIDLAGLTFSLYCPFLLSDRPDNLLTNKVLEMSKNGTTTMLGATAEKRYIADVLKGLISL